MKKSLETIDRWGPGVVALISILALVAYGWTTDQRIAKLEGMVQVRIQAESNMRAESESLKQELAAIKNWVIAVYERADAKNWDLPNLPEAVK